MCTQVACQNQINVLTVFLLAKKFACDQYDFIGQSEVVFYGFFQRLVIPVAVGSRPLGTRSTLAHVRYIKILTGIPVLSGLVFSLIKSPLGITVQTKS